MEILEKYELILDQALEELGHFDTLDYRENHLEIQALMAPRLGDIVYRLTVEHDVAFTPFRETVIGLIAERQEAVAPHNPNRETARPFAARIEYAHSLILLSLEMMPPDSPLF